MNVGCSKSVAASGIPQQETTTGPRYDGHPIWPLPIGSQQACRLKPGWYFRGDYGTAKVPSRLEPTGLLRSDGKRPDGMSIIPWSSGRLLVWDATCCDTFAASNIPTAVTEPGAVTCD